MLKERNIEDYLHRRVKELGGEYRRLKWQGRNDAPDDLILLPGRHILIECKKPGEVPSGAQLREHERLRSSGFEVHVAESFEDIDSSLPKRKVAP